MIARGDLVEIVEHAVIRRAVPHVLGAPESPDFDRLGDALTDVRPSTPAIRALACDAWVVDGGHHEAAAWAMADREGFADLDAWIAAECAAQGVVLAGGAS